MATAPREDLQPIDDEQGSVPPLLEALLGVHNASSLDWVADAAATAAERGLGALYTFLYVVDTAGQLVGERPASSARMRLLAKLNQALDTNLTALRFEPEAVLAVSSALSDGHIVAVRELSHALPLAMEAGEVQAVQRRLGIGKVWLAPLFSDGEGLGLLVMLMPEQPPAPPALGELLGYHVAVALKNQREREAGRKRGELDAVRWVYDQKRFEDELSQEIQRAQRHARPMSIMVLRVDNFHDLRERYGRFLAERILRQVGGELESAMRLTDFLGAFKEDGFAAILVEADQPAAGLARERLTRGLKNIHLPNAELDDASVSLSCATATMPDDGQTGGELFAAAEARLEAPGAALTGA